MAQKLRQVHNPEPEGYDLPPTQQEYHLFETYNQPIMRPPPDVSWLTFEPLGYKQKRKSRKEHRNG